MSSLPADSQATDADAQATDVEAQATDVEVQANDSKTQASDTDSLAADFKSMAIDSKTQATDADALADDSKSQAIEANSPADDSKTQANDDDALAADSKTQETDSNAPAPDSKSPMTDADLPSTKTNLKAPATDADPPSKPKKTRMYDLISKDNSRITIPLRAAVISNKIRYDGHGTTETHCAIDTATLCKIAPYMVKHSGCSEDGKPTMNAVELKEWDHSVFLNEPIRILLNMLYAALWLQIPDLQYLLEAKLSPTNQK